MKDFLVVGLMVVAGAVPPADGQDVQPSQAWFVAVQGGLAYYYGDMQSAAPVDAVRDVGMSVEAGYRLSSTFALAVAYQRGEYAALTTAQAYGGRDAAQLLVQYTPARFGRWHPVLTAGMHTTEGAEYASFGPAVGVGVAVSLGSYAELLGQLLTSITLPDAATDGVLADHLSGIDRRRQLDLLTHVGLGLRVYL